MNQPTTMHTGPLGSTIHVLRADAETVAALAAVDWSRYFRRVCLDPVGGLVTLMAPSFSHDDLGDLLAEVVKTAGNILTGTIRGLHTTRLRKRGDPPGTGMEPDCAFYVGERARDFRAAVAQGPPAADAFLERIAPDLVIEVEITSIDESKIERYAEMGVRELWRLRGHRETWEFQVDFLALSPGGAPRRIGASEVLTGLTADDVCEAVDRVRSSPDPDEQKEAVARIVQRRKSGSVRVREEAAAYSAS